MRAGISSIFARILRWGKSLEPVWIFGPYVTQPTGGYILVEYEVPARHKGYIYGFMITATEPNTFEIRWEGGSGPQEVLIKFGGSGTVKDVSPIPLNVGSPAIEQTYIEIVVGNNGSPGSIYQAGLLVGVEKA